MDSGTRRLYSAYRHIQPEYTDGGSRTPERGSRYPAGQELPGRAGSHGLDTGTVESLAKAGEYVKLAEEVQSIKISVPEEIAYYNGWIDEAQLLEAAEGYGKSPYGQHLRNIATGKVQTSLKKKNGE